MERKLIALLSFILFFGYAFLLLTGSSVLEYEVLSDPVLPAGLFITWIGMVAFPVLLYFGFTPIYNPTSSWLLFLSRTTKGLIILAVSWAPVSYLLAGNFTFSFTVKATFQGGQLASEIFWHFSYFVAGAPFLILFSIALYYLKSLSSK